MSNRLQNRLIVIFSSLIMVFLIYIGSTTGKQVKADLTEEKLYSLSEGTEKILSKLTGKITLKLYYSKTAANKGAEGIRTFNNYFVYVRDLLDEYVAKSRNNLSLEVIDPRPNTKDEENAIAYGLQKFQLSETERYFFGLVVKSESGTEKVIEFFDPAKQETLEYDITKIIYTTVKPQKKKIGILSPLPVLKEEVSPYMAQMMRMQGKAPEESWLITKMIKEIFDVTTINPDTEKITGIDVLFIIHPKDFSDKTLFAIDQYVLGGGKVLLLVDPFSVVDRPKTPSYMPTPQNSNLKKLMDQWGVELVEDRFLGDPTLAGSGQASPNSSMTSRILAIVQCDSACTEPHNEVISSTLDSMTFVVPGALKILGGEGVKITPIVTTTEKGNTYKAGPNELRDLPSLWKKFTEGDKPLPIGLKIVGKFKSAFPDGVEITEKKDDKEKTANNEEEKSEKTTRKLTGLTESTKESAIIVFSDVDFIFDQFAFKRSFLGVGLANQSSTLVLNSLETLSGSKDLLSVRSRAKYGRPFELVDEIELKAELRTAKKVEEINTKIKQFTKELESLGKDANSSNIGLLQTKGIQKRKELEKNIAHFKGELREVRRKEREHIEALGKRLQYYNTLFMPSILLIFGLFFRYFQKRKLINSSKNQRN